jgi:hypothetical protein
MLPGCRADNFPAARNDVRAIGYGMMYSVPPNEMMKSPPPPPVSAVAVVLFTQLSVTFREPLQETPKR